MIACAEERLMSGRGRSRNQGLHVILKEGPKESERQGRDRGERERREDKVRARGERE